MGLTKPGEKRQRAFELMKKVVYEGKSRKQAAKEMGISTDTAERSLAWAEEAKIFVEYEHRLFNELLPLAHETAKIAMEDGDATVAMKIMEMVNKKTEKQQEIKGGSNEPSGGLYAAILAQRAGDVIDITPEPDDDAGHVLQGTFRLAAANGIESGAEIQGESGPEDLDATNAPGEDAK